MPSTVPCAHAHVSSSLHLGSLQSDNRVVRMRASHGPPTAQRVHVGERVSVRARQRVSARATQYVRCTLAHCHVRFCSYSCIAQQVCTFTQDT
eukprot:2419441-Pleurochrysis_carterae.AAC.3